jgi:hypothetical protein
MRAAVIVVACLAIVAFASPAQIKRDSVSASASISFSGNVTLTNSTQTQTLAFREVNAFVVDVSILGFNFNGFFSDAAQITAVPGQATVDLVASAFFIESGLYPQGYVAYFDAQENYKVNPSGIGSSADVLTLLSGLTASGGLAGIGYVQLDELNPSGNVVTTVDFSKITFNQASSGVQTDSTGYIKYAWISNTPASGGALYNFTVLHSSVLGKLSYGATVTPKSSDVILSISNYPYASSSNQLRLTAVTAFALLNFTGSAIVSGAANAVALGSGANQFYFNGATSAQVNGNSASVSVQVTASATVSSSIQAQIGNIVNTINNAFGGKAGSAVLTATFPAGASSIIYDPVAGFEQPSTNGSAAFHASVFTVVIGAIVALFGAHL